MYNRYVPRPDGSYQKKRVHEPRKNDQTKHPNPATNRHNTPMEPIFQDQPRTIFDGESRQEHQSAGNFLKNLLPKDFDTGDLIVVLLLLLMAGDCEEDRNTALLTLMLYFFM